MPVLTGFGMENFRVFKEHTHFDLAPITVLTGTNSSGKSSLFKGLLLMRDNVFKEELWDELDYSGRGHRLGTFQQSCNNQSGKQEIRVSFQFDFSKEYEVEPLTQHPEFPFFSLIECNLTFLPKERENGILRRLEVLAEDETLLDIEGHSEETYNGGRIYFNFPWFIQKLRSILAELPDEFPTQSPFSGKNYASYSFSSMEDMKPFFNYSKMVKKIGRYAAESIEQLLLLESTILRDSFTENYLVGDTISIRFTVGEDNLNEGEPRKLLYKEGIEFIESMFLALTSKMFFSKNYGESVSAYAYSVEENVKSLEKMVSEFFEIMTDPDREMQAFPDMYSFIGNSSFSDYSIDDKTVTIEIDDKDISAIPFRDLVKPGVFHFLAAVSKGVRGIFHNLRNLKLIYSEAIRANSRRLYANEDQSTGFTSLLVKLRNNPLDQYKLDFVNKWIKEFELADEFFVDGLEGVASRVTLRKGEKILTLADLGYGITQLLPIILNIAFYNDHFEKEFEKNTPRKLMLIEEPESNLHPALQSKLADMFIDAYRKFKVQFIIETHSEYLIRKLQYLTATKEITREDTAVYYLYDPANIPEGEPQVKRLNILPDGRLDGQFGPGFFDETARLMIGTLTGENLN